MFRLSPRLRIIDACSKADVCGEADANLSLLAGHRGKLFFIYQFKKIFNLLFLSGSIMGSMDLAEDADCFVLSLSKIWGVSGSPELKNRIQKVI